MHHFALSRGGVPLYQAYLHQNLFMVSSSVCLFSPCVCMCVRVLLWVRCWFTYSVNVVCAFEISTVRRVVRFPQTLWSIYPLCSHVVSLLSVHSSSSSFPSSTHLHYQSTISHVTRESVPVFQPLEPCTEANIYLSSRHHYLKKYSTWASFCNVSLSRIGGTSSLADQILKISKDKNVANLGVKRGTF